MSFRSRLTVFFVVIVVVPMAAMAFLVFRLIDDSQSGKADARASGLASAAVSVYQNASVQASYQARMLARDLARGAGASAPRSAARAHALASATGLARVVVRSGSRVILDQGTRPAVAPGIALVAATAGRPALSVAASQLTASQYAHELSGPGVAIAVRSGSQLLATTLPAADHRALPSPHGSVTIGGTTYRVQTESFAGFDGTRVQASILSNVAYGGSVSADRLLAAIFIAGFLVLAFFFSLLSSRALQSQVSRFLDAARRLASGDFSSPVPTTGNDEFALLGEEFNYMSRQLERRLDELAQERSRVREAIRRIGEAFASGLDRDALLALSLRTAMDATSSDRGRISARRTATEALSEARHVGRLAGLEPAIYEAERAALAAAGTGQATAEGSHVAAAALGSIIPAGPSHGVLTVCRPEPFSADDLELLRTLAAQTTLALANVNLHHAVQHQAITDDLTGLASHGHFQQLLSAEMEEVRRYRYPVGLIMLDIDDFKAVNDLHGHQQGDIVLRAVADALQETKRDVDVAARYGGEELALILPHTELPGAYEMAERARQAIGELEIPILGGRGTLRITASAGVASSSEGDKDGLIAAADAALYTAKREGKNRTVRAAAPTADVIGGE